MNHLMAYFLVQLNLYPKDVGRNVLWPMKSLSLAVVVIIYNIDIVSKHDVTRDWGLLRHSTL